MKRSFGKLIPTVALALSLLLTACGAPAPQEEPSSDAPPATVPEALADPQKLWLEETVDAMTTEEKVGQLFFVRCPEENAAEDVASYHLGGVLLFGRDFKEKTRDEILAFNRSLQERAAIPLILGADEEGGTVVRASSNPNLRPERYKSPQNIYKEGGLSALHADALEKSIFLQTLGINVNLAPVCDLTENPEDFMYDRSMGLPAEETAAAIETMVSAMNETRMGSVLKHFPGYGSNVDTHTGIAIDERSMEEFLAKDFKPFKAGIEAGAGSVLVSHNIINCMDETHPASLSAPVHRVLRDELHFGGVIMTDDLAMDALAAYTESGEENALGDVILMALAAGNDMVITTDYRDEIPYVVEKIEAGVIPEETIDAAVTRVLQWKLHLGLIVP